MNTTTTFSKICQGAVLAVALVFVANFAIAQPYVLRTQVVGNGGVSFAQNGTSVLGATVGQAIVGPATSGSTKLGQGFWYTAEQTIDVREVSAPIPTALELSQNYPNPFNPSTKIMFKIPEGTSQEVRLNVYNAVGVLVKTLVSETMNQGTYEATFDGAGFSSGVYMYELRVGAQSVMKKMIMSK